ncbi:spore coat protein CotJB [Paenibacillus rhizovicinus]|uniref:Spore coat protein CotJB n=1 Tax=Paenibacillus rhizovicinus TaxID=2704463 RepID=A0A6C0NWQ6_9BACL|nr:spore coat protein CotJB [Paenibacillus rhizovicinus]QHW30650.1 spore coat protein CotJB [Paenibacillus rhizovicinus]
MNRNARRGRPDRVNNQLDEQYYSKLLELQQLDFGLVELTLYLDTHPNDLQALQQFNQLAQQRKHCAQQFEMQYGPLMQFGHSFSKYPWQWIETPWPWQV